MTDVQLVDNASGSVIPDEVGDHPREISLGERRNGLLAHKTCNRSIQHLDLSRIRGRYHETIRLVHVL